MRGLSALFFVLIVFLLILGVFINFVIGNINKSSPIYCPETGKVVYYYQGDLDDFNIRDFKPNSENFKPANRSIKHPDRAEDLVCPGTNTPLNGYLYWFWKRKYNQPRIVYEGFTFLTKENGNMVWRPVDIESWKD